MQGAWVWSLVGELRSHMPRGVAKKLKKKKFLHRWLDEHPWGTLNMQRTCPPFTDYRSEEKPQNQHISMVTCLSFLFLVFWLCWVFVSVRGLSLVAARGDHSSSRCAGLSLSRPLLLRSTGSRRAGSATVAHGPSCSVACGIFPDQGSNPCLLHWQADSQPLRHQGSPINF